MLAGIRAPFKGAQFIFHSKKMISVALLPFLLNLGLLFLFFYFGFTFGQGWVEGILQNYTWSQGWIGGLLGGILKTALFLLLMFLISIFYLSTAAIIASPFNEILSVMTEKRILGDAFKEYERPFWKELQRIIKQEVRKIFILLLLMIISSIIQVIPLLGSAIYFLFNYVSLAFFTGMEYLDFPLERRGYDYSAKLRYSLKNFFLSTGIGITTTFLFYIPLMFHFSAVGATLEFLQREKSDAK